MPTSWFGLSGAKCGDIGFVETIDLELGETTYAFGELDQIVLAYATTIHKSRGSEYRAVVIPVTIQHYTIAQRNLLACASQRIAPALPG